MIKKLKNQDGFTLLEVIISIAALSVLSVFILQMFVTSSNANMRAQDIDIAVTKALAAIEPFKALDDERDLALLADGYAHAEATGDGFMLTQAYARNKDGANAFWEKTATDGGVYVVYVTIQKAAGQTDAADVGVLYTMDVRVVDRSKRVNLFAGGSDNAEVELVRYTADRYLKNKQ